MVAERRIVHHLLGHEQKKVAQLRRAVYRGLSLEQTHESVSQLDTLAGRSRTAFCKKAFGPGR